MSTNYEKRKLNIGTQAQFDANKGSLPVGSEWGVTDLINIDDLDDSLKEKINNPYPVGAIFITTDNTTSPAEIFGGTWEQIKDTFLLAAGDTYTAGSTGGSADAVVVSHTHTLRGRNDDDGSNTNAVKFSTTATNDGSYYSDMYNSASNGGTGILSSGESGTGKNMPPYLVVYVWKRVA